MNTDKSTRRFDEISITFIILIIISIIFSISIALMADIPDSSGHGGFIYIIGPGFIGLVLLLIYLVFLGPKPQWKSIAGATIIIINLIVGLIFMNTTF